jgi:scyllo-inositol 2-dehydrogenase (NADP+)
VKKIRVGIIGQGRSGHNIHVHTITKLVPDLFEVAAVADPLEERMQEMKEAGARTYADYRQMLGQKDIDLIVNATPSHLHVPVTIESLKAGFHTLCEKPAAPTAADLDKAVAAANKSGRLYAIFQQSRFAPYFRKVREVIDSGVLGRPVMIKVAFNGFGRRWDWQTLQEYRGGNLLNTGPHPLDQALNLFGGADMPKVFCLMDRAVTYGDAEDVVKLVLSGKGHPTIDLEISSCSAYNPYTYQVHATQGSLTGTMDHVEWKWFKPEEAPPQKLIREPLPGRKYCQEDLQWHTESWDFPKDGPPLFDVMARAFYLNLHAVLAEGKPLEVPLDQVRRQIAVIEECHRQNPLSKLK